MFSLYSVYVQCTSFAPHTDILSSRTAVADEIKFIGGFIISDETQAAKFSTPAEAAQRAMTIANQVDLLFQPVKTRFIVVGQEVRVKPL